MLNKNIKPLIILIGLVIVTAITFATNELVRTKTTSAINDAMVFSVDEKVALPALVSLIDGHIQKVTDCLTLTAMTDEVKSGDWNKMKGLLDEVTKVNIPSVIWFTRPDGSYYTTERGFIANQNLKDRDYFPIVMSGKPVIGSLVFSKSTGKKSLIVTIPVMKKEKIVGAVGASIFLEQFSDLVIKEMNLPDDIVFYALDKDAQTVIHRDTFRVFQHPTQLGNETLAIAITQIMSQPEGSVNYIFQGTNRIAYFQLSLLTGWRIVLGKVMPMTQVENKTKEK
jgi:hypothetical protein